ncbi:hypothetical protein D9753_23310 [Streptomyces dangxiongensis]|uniref:Uncharacterized protein n=1 Tax=Streptomyces dangxiongensis TaxID=1442032 RepID=A0A3G2JI79_9ACTN|nr:hypothetical protein [Streptomyces dangxiongensis]AYN41321.1 hypothetical protein D9753_23310 [Streptomyces dangxiongensis]
MATVADAGLSWPAVGGIVLAPAVWALLSLLVADYVHGALLHRARGTGIAVTRDALTAAQERPLPAGATERLRAGLAGSGRAYDVVDGGPLEFRWRPLRGPHAVTGCVTVDETSGEPRLRLHTDEAPRGMPGERTASASVALCRMTRLAEAE